MPPQAVLFGGTFDPIHHGHLLVARAVAEHFGFPRITFVPAAVPPHKLDPGERGGRAASLRLPVASPEDRLEMVRLAIAGEEVFEVSDVELRRPAPSYTIETLLEFRRRLGQDARLYWLIGADMLEDLPNWRRTKEVVEQATIVTAVRQPFSRQIPEILGRIAGKLGTERAARLEAGLCPTPTVDISSTAIRQRIFVGQSILYLTHCRVIEYIKSRKLYSQAAGSI